MKKITKLKTGKLSRALDLIGLVASSSQKALSYKIQSQLSSRSEQAGIELLRKQIETIAKKFGNLKGGLMKVGQILSVYGEYFLPKDINDTLKNLQYKSQPFEWNVLKSLIEKELGDEVLKSLDVQKEPLAAASIGQVHLAALKSTDTKIALKIQYPGVDEAVTSDISSLKAILNLAELFPNISHLELLFEEVQYMMKQELDYINEMNWTNQYKRKLKNDIRFIVPKTFPEYTSTRVIATSYEPGFDIDSEQVKNLSQERRNKLSLHALDLYFKELFVWGHVQTDPHIGNYKIRINENEQDQIILYDFGATREFSSNFLKYYRRLIKNALDRDYSSMEKTSLALNFIKEDDPQTLKDLFYDFCIMMVEPFRENYYDWRNTEIPKKLSQMVGQVMTQFKVRAPPREVIFLDRKTTGVFIFLSILGAQINAKPLLESYLDGLE